jgi:hypothetical protein
VSVLGEAGLSATIELVARVVRHVEVTPAVAAVSHLSGAPAMSGFRAAADKAAPQLRQARDLRYTLLDDVPVATLISGHALSASGVLGEYTKSGYLPVADQCAGFATGGLLMTSFEAGDPAVVTGPHRSRSRPRRRPVGVAPDGAVAAARDAPQASHRRLRGRARADRYRRHIP